MTRGTDPTRGCNGADVAGLIVAVAATVILLRGRRYGAPRDVREAHEPPVPSARMPLSKVHRFGIVGIAILLAVLVLLFLVDISDGASTRTVLLAATMLAEAQFLVNVLRECEPRAWWMVSACAGLLPVGVVLAGALPDASAQVTVGLIFTVLTLVSFVAITIADAAGRFSTTWAWRATPEWRAAAVREVRSHTEARRANRSQRP